MRIPSRRMWRTLLLGLGLAIGCAGVEPAPVNHVARPENDLQLEEDTRVPNSGILGRALESDDPAVRAQAARAMGRIQSLVCIPPLLEALDDADPTARAEVVFALGQMALGPQWKPEGREPIVPALVARLGEASIRAVVVEALGKIGGDGVETTIAAQISDPDTAVRQEAALALFRLRYQKHIEAFSPASLTALRRAVRDSDPEVRWRAAYAVSHKAVPEMIDALVPLTRDANVWVRLFAVRALGRAATPAQKDTLRHALKDSEYLVRVEAINAIRLAEISMILDVSLLGDPSPHVRAAAARALKSGGVLDASAMVRAVAAQRTGQFDHDGESHPWVVSRALLSPKFTGSLASWLNHRDPLISSTAAEALIKKRTEDNLKLLIALLEDPDRPLEMRGSAVEAVTEWKDPDLLASLQECYRNSRAREFVEVRESIVDAAAALEATGFLKTLLKDDSPSVRIKAARALKQEAEAGPPPAPSPFLGTAFERNPIVVIETSRGEMEVECFASDAPVHVASFIDLIRKGTYDGLIWHRVVSNFVIQGADPRGSGWGDAGYNIRDEINRRKYARGTVGMPKAGKDTGGCQIFITHTPTPHLDGRYTIFGQVVGGLEVIDKIEPLDKIIRIRVQE